MTADRSDHYAVLGVPSTAAPQQITHAFHRMVRLHHPDTQVQQGDVADLDEVIAAYHVLRDPARRADYDRRQLPPPPLAPPIRSASGAAEPAIRIGPVHYHGPARPTHLPD